jgi:hypothetical protein
MNVRRIFSPSEKIVERCPILGAFNADRNLRDGKFVMKLACGHHCYTRNINVSVCPRCTEMLRRSVTDGREDWDSFRKGLKTDTMEWPSDPCRQFNEQTDLAGQRDKRCR